MHFDVTSMIFAYCPKQIFQERSKIMNFHKRSYQPILRYLYTEVIQRRGKISLHLSYTTTPVVIKIMHSAPLNVLHV